MKDPITPTFKLNLEQNIILTIDQTDAIITDQGLHYNEPGLSYNQAGDMYGGVSQETQDVIPLLLDTKDFIPSLVIDRTDAFLEDQGYTYNQTGFAYNQIGVDYGGLVNVTQDIMPMVLSTDNTTPHADLIYDIYIPKPTPPVPSRNGPGWFMYINLT